MQDAPQRQAKTIRINDRVYHRARIAAVTSRSSLGQWLEGAIMEKLQRESGSSPQEEAHDAQD